MQRCLVPACMCSHNTSQGAVSCSSTWLLDSVALLTCLRVNLRVCSDGMCDVLMQRRVPHRGHLALRAQLHLVGHVRLKQRQKLVCRQRQK